MTREDLEAGAPLVGGPEIDQPNDTAMGEAPQHAQFAEILVERDQDASFFARVIQQPFIARVFGLVTGPDHVMSGGLQLGFAFWTQAGVQQDLQEPASIERGSIRSLAAMRRA